ncbi:M20 family peptidase [Deinococcus metallilatus]|uniref:M20 family metallopeptidase n=2 Tax=Deinococcus metallilatus TaxID=1211322 RepID=A0AAJ5F4K2_9DEIO|nr:M20 family metallopeptidase [Deinococcus metallilatus]QBY07855.1 M20 family peptidase [Deinococcus metallilatus]RXJ13204.1 M20 family peptidase [Deinococcus metallilatus]TLK23023.1 M20 family metallopeptidase [Deinococcus metallilatus]GMA15977.1 carboxypeptidase [Deinococcus metallilatus]
MGGMTFDLQAMLDDLRALVEIESPSTDMAAVNRVMAVVEAWARELGADTHALPGGTRRFNFGVEEEGRPVLVLAHADTVWPHGTLDAMPFRVEEDRAYGPGTYDMKAGIVGLFHALRALEGQWPEGGVQVLLTPDEEIGSLGSRDAIEAAARQARAVLVVEPPVADLHALKVGRKGVGDFQLAFRGVASHAGNKPEEGASAITEAARAVLELEALARPEVGTTVSVGLIRGGSATNVIPAECELELDVRVSTLEEGERIDAAIRALRPRNPRVRLEVTGGLNRPPFERGPQTERLFAQARAIAEELGFEVGGEIVGGGSDGNFTAPLAPTLDGLGAPGDGAHAAHEHVRLDRWPDHVRLLTRLLREA